MMASLLSARAGCRFARRTCLHKVPSHGIAFQSVAASAPRGYASFVQRRPAVDFDPASTSGACENQLLGIEVKPEDASLVIIPVAWAATASGGKGTESAPPEIIELTRTLDAFQADFVGLGLGDPWKFGMSVLPASSQLEAWASEAQEAADADEIGKVDKISSQLHDWVEARAAEHIASGQRVAVLGGDHSTPLGLIRAVGKAVGHFGILHVDAHLDMRPHRDDEFIYGHDKIMYNVLREVPSLSSFVTVGARDFCRAELDVAHNDHRVAMYVESTIRGRMSRGETWNGLIKEIVGRLPQQVYLSIDIDGLDPCFCPNTGTPVPGGLSFPELVELVLEVCRSGRTIVGFDLVEVGSGRVDTITGATLLLKLCAALLHSNGARDAAHLPKGEHVTEGYGDWPVMDWVPDLDKTFPTVAESNSQ